MVFLIANNSYIMKSILRKHAFNVGNKTYIKSMNRTPYVFRTYYQTLYMCFEKKNRIWYEKHAFYVPLQNLHFLHIVTHALNLFSAKPAFNTRSNKRLFYKTFI